MAIAHWYGIAAIEPHRDDVRNCDDGLSRHSAFRTTLIPLLSFPRRIAPVDILFRGGDHLPEQIVEVLKRRVLAGEGIDGRAGFI